MEKVLHLIINGKEIVYDKNGSHTYILKVKLNDDTYERYTKKHDDQLRANKLIDELYNELHGGK